MNNPLEWRKSETVVAKPIGVFVLKPWCCSDIMVFVVQNFDLNKLLIHKYNLYHIYLKVLSSEI